VDHAVVKGELRLGAEGTASSKEPWMVRIAHMETT